LQTSPTKMTMTSECLTPIELAKVLETSPQMVYYWIRRGVIDTEECSCGRTVVRVERARAALAAHKRETETETEIDNAPNGSSQESFSEPDR
jgi:hypothetical protein